MASEAFQRAWHRGFMPTEFSGSTYDRLKTRLKTRIVDVVTGTPSGEKPRLDGQELEAYLRQTFREVAEESRTTRLPPEEESRLIHEILEEMADPGPLSHLLSDPTVTEIMVNGPSEIFVERDGRLQRTEARFRDANHLMATIEQMLNPLGLSVNESHACCDAHLPDGSRMNVIISPLVLNGPVVTIRRKLRPWSIPEYIAGGALSGQVAEFLQACVRAKVNMVVSGGTSTGKTTLVTMLSASIPLAERIITIENVQELELSDHAHWVRLVAKGANMEGRGEIPLRTLVMNALRMRPDRIILGEARGGEALDVVQAMHTGHDGVITVLHAGSPQAALERLEALMLMSGIDFPPQACRLQLASAVELIVHMARFADGSRRIAAITHVAGLSEKGFMLEDLFTFDVQKFAEGGALHGGLCYTGVRPSFLRKFQLNNVPIPAWLSSEKQ